MSQSLHKEVLVPTYQPNLQLVRGCGSRVWDIDNKEYVDLTSGIAVLSLGHCHPPLVKILQQQATQLWHASNLFITQPVLDLAAALCASTFAEQVFFANSGAEANEAALKLARKYASDNYSSAKHQIIACTNSFHGRTLFTISAGGKEQYRTGFAPLPKGLKHVPYNDLVAMEQVISEKTCAVIVEPVQGEGGVIVPDANYLAGLRRLCDKYNALLILDEVQTGMGRTGKLYAYMHSTIAPDILTTAKALGNGMPISAMLTSKEIARSFGVGSHGTTYGGNPLACKVALEVLNTINHQQFLEQVAVSASIFYQQLNNINDKHNIFSDIRMNGLLLGAQLQKEYAAKTKLLLEYAQEEGVLLLAAGDGNVIRLAPPLNISEQDILESMHKFDMAVARLLSSSV
jgi:predicted acetylornithine/succinylornithine family transaminase